MMLEQKIVGNSPELERAMHAARLAAFVDAPVVVTGESGVGRSLLAQVVHASGHRRDQSMLRLVCSNLRSKNFPFDVLIDDAGKDSVTEAAGGTLILADVGELDADSQLGLLNFIESGEQKRLDLRLLVTATDQLADRVGKGEFLESLYYRLNVVSIEMASLSERQGDLKLMLNHFLAYYASLYKRSAPKFSRAAQQCLKRYDWPGNVRELRNLCERMAILLPGKTIEPENLPSEFSAPRRKVAIPGFVLPESGIDLELLERDLIRQALDQTEGNRSGAARLLGISRDTLNYRLKKFALDI